MFFPSCRLLIQDWSKGRSQQRENGTYLGIAKSVRSGRRVYPFSTEGKKQEQIWQVQKFDLEKLDTEHEFAGVATRRDQVFYPFFFLKKKCFFSNVSPCHPQPMLTFPTPVPSFPHQTWLIPPLSTMDWSVFL